MKKRMKGEIFVYWIKPLLLLVMLIKTFLLWYFLLQWCPVAWKIMYFWQNIFHLFPYILSTREYLVISVPISSFTQYSLTCPMSKLFCYHSIIWRCSRHCINDYILLCRNCARLTFVDMVEAYVIYKANMDGGESCKFHETPRINSVIL